MKNRYLIALFILASMVVLFGALLKIIHFEFGPITGNVLLAIGVLLQIFVGLAFVIKLLLTPKGKSDFLNK